MMICRYVNEIGLLVAQVHLPALNNCKKTLEGHMYSRKNDEIHARICVLVNLGFRYLEQN